MFARHSMLAVMGLIAVMCVMHRCDGATSVAFTSCYLFHGDVADLSFTYADNFARIQAHSEVISAVSVNLVSNAYSNVDQTRNLTQMLDRLISEDQCDLIVSTSHVVSSMIDIVEYGATRPVTSFVFATEGTVWDTATQPSNVANYIAQAYQGMFAAGAVASSQAASSCVGFIYESTQKSWIPDSFYRGMLWSGQPTPLFAVDLDLDSSEAAESILIGLLITKGCTVIASMSTNNIVASAVAAYDSESIMSIAYGSDASLIAGDSVLTSLYLDLTNLFYNITIDALNYSRGSITSLPQTYTAWKSSELVLADVSPRADADLVQLASDARAYVDSTNASCGTFTDEHGSVHTGCLPEGLKSSYPFLDSRIHHMTSWRPPTFCPPGTRYTYAVTDFSLTCVPCAPNTFSALSGSSACSPCPIGLNAAAGSAQCTVSSESSGFQPILGVPIAFGIFLVLLAAAGVLVLALRVHIDPSRDPKYAPRHGDIALAMIGVDGTRSDRQWRANLTNMCEVYDRLASIVTPLANATRAYVFVSVGDVVMMAAEQPSQLLQLLTEINERATAARWPCKIRLKMVLHVGTPSVGETKRHNPDEEVGVTYSGPDIDHVRALWRKDLGCDLVLTKNCAGLLPLNPDRHRTLDPPTNLTQSDRQIGGGSIVCVDFISPLVVAPADGTGVENPLDVGPPQGDGESEMRKSTVSSATSDTTSEANDDDLARLVTPTAITKEELDALRTFGVELLQKFLRVFSFDDQVSLVTAVAKKLHVLPPQIPEMKTAVKKSFNVLRNSLKLICNQLLLSMDDKELQSWLDSVASSVRQREESNAANEDLVAQPTTMPS